MCTSHLTIPLVLRQSKNPQKLLSKNDSYQTMMADRVEVLRGPASVLYGSNAMGGVINIVTRRPAYSQGTSTQANIAVGSYGTIQAEASNQLRSGKFSSTVAAQYGRTDNHRANMGFEQYGGYLKLGYDINENWSASLSGNVTHWNASLVAFLCWLDALSGQLTVQ